MTDPTPPDAFADDAPPLLAINGPDGRACVLVCQDGSVLLGDGITLDEAARQFWDAVTQAARSHPLAEKPAGYVAASRDQIESALETEVFSTEARGLEALALAHSEGFTEHHLYALIKVR